MTFNTDTVEKNLSTIQYYSVGGACGFSWTPCWACKRPLGGERHKLEYTADGAAYYEEICADCALYIENGELPEGEASDRDERPNCIAKASAAIQKARGKQ